ncbi:CDP-diacylglycerol--glycerol-3-phosphate 3-phosphatidyltransferase [Clostridium hydrogenum]|uniref:CDP-diacylglycerol--glycerol-3-phosphate 3-phosphatidyltransferase n=1 Tax=Clostridium hydrogenum TaxID=2855764 RepID=UPI001F181832|nr:CDP-diacylglycerol--glycerol-3-phosphate 3-phosphatidyltransferase [Clostridium hydrogenum]
MNIANVLTIFRFILIPYFIFVFFSNSSNSLYLSVIIFFAAGFTDILDGYIARNFNMVTKIGTVLDPLADKLMLITVLSCFTLKNYIPMFIIIILLIKELSMILTGILLYQQNIIIPANIFGKASTFLFYISILFIVFSKVLGIILLYSATLTTLIAYVNYFFIFMKKRQM